MSCVEIFAHIKRAFQGAELSAALHCGVAHNIWDTIRISKVGAPDSTMLMIEHFCRRTELMPIVSKFPKHNLAITVYFLVQVGFQLRHFSFCTTVFHRGWLHMNTKTMMKMCVNGSLALNEYMCKTWEWIARVYGFKFKAVLSIVSIFQGTTFFYSWYCHITEVKRMHQYLGWPLFAPWEENPVAHHPLTSNIGVTSGSCIANVELQT